MTSKYPSQLVGDTHYDKDIANNFVATRRRKPFVTCAVSMHACSIYYQSVPRCQGIRNPANVRLWNPESISAESVNPRLRIRDPLFGMGGIWNPMATWIRLHRGLNG